MVEEERDLTKNEEWFRDRLINYIGYGFAGFTVIAGWLISSDSIISIDFDASTDKKEAAVILALLLPTLWIIWYAVLLNLHSKCPPHPTVINRRYLHFYAAGVAIVLFILWFMVADVHLTVR